MLEIYQAYSDHRGMMELIRSLIQGLCRDVLGTTTIRRADGGEIELGGEWREVKYDDLIIEATGDKGWFERSRDEKIAIFEKIAQEKGLKVQVDHDTLTAKSRTTCTKSWSSRTSYSPLS